GSGRIAASGIWTCRGSEWWVAPASRRAAHYGKKFLRGAWTAVDCRRADDCSRVVHRKQRDRGDSILIYSSRCSEGQYRQTQKILRQFARSALLCHQGSNYGVTQRPLEVG